MTHMYVRKLTSSGDGLLRVRRQAITSNKAGKADL